MRNFIALLFLCVSASLANAGQDAAGVRRAIDDFMKVQVKGLPGTASYTIGNIVTSDRLGACPNLQVSLPKGGRLWGRSNVVVHCDEPGWSLYVPVRVKVVGAYLVSSRALRQGQQVVADDVATQTGDLAELPSGTITELAQAVGHTLAISLAAGQPLRSDVLRQALIIQQGQTVKVVSRGPGFEVANEGEALNNAAQGQLVRVRLGTGQLLSGIADGPGTVTVSY